MALPHSPTDSTSSTVPLHDVPHRRRRWSRRCVFVFLFGPWIIDHLRLKQGKGQPIRTDGPQSHLVTKKGTPTMGGLMILLGDPGVDAAVGEPRQCLCLDRAGVTLSLRGDRLLRRLSQGHQADPCGLFRQATLRHRSADRAGIACYLLGSLGREPFASSLTFPFFKELVLPLGWFFVVFGAFVIVGAGNAVNLTDGLDGLAIGPVMIAAAVLRLLRLSWSATRFSPTICSIHYVPGTGELPCCAAP